MSKSRDGCHRLWKEEEEERARRRKEYDHEEDRNTSLQRRV